MSLLFPKRASFLGRATNAQLLRPRWDSAQSVLSNIGRNVQDIRQRGQRLVQEQDALREMNASLNPQGRQQNLQEYFRHGDYVTEPLDKILYRGWPTVLRGR